MRSATAVSTSSRVSMPSPAVALEMWEKAVTQCTFEQNSNLQLVDQILLWVAAGHLKKITDALKHVRSYWCSFLLLFVCARRPTRGLNVFHDTMFDDTMFDACAYLLAARRRSVENFQHVRLAATAGDCGSCKLWASRCGSLPTRRRCKCQSSTCKGGLFLFFLISLVNTTIKLWRAMLLMLHLKALPSGTTAFLAAADRGDIRMLGLLLSHGADPMAQDSEGRCGLEVCG